ncbi:MAG TPA: hypothetical protein VHY84_08195 [Bryobacteraceae bacterium]|jgi:hypothetical protein|nr:hypothetical protein [Bryobacteraceae bacterium]
MSFSHNRRVGLAFPLHLSLKCRRIRPQVRWEQLISGQSLKISSRDFVFTSSETIPPGQVLEVFVDWPVLLDNRIRLALVLEGVVVSSDPHIAMRIDKYQFKTRGTLEAMTASASTTSFRTANAMVASAGQSSF